MRNKEIRDALRLSDVKQWQLAEALEVSDITICRWLRKELPDEKRKMILRTIEEIRQKQNDE